MLETEFSTIERDSRGYVQWTEEQINYICSSYKEHKETGYSLAKLFNVNRVCIYSVLKRNGILREDKLRNKKDKNSCYFSKINSIDKAYWLGMLYADGNVQENHTIKLKLIDKEHIEKFCKAINLSETYIYTYKNTLKNRQTPYEIRFKDKQMYKDLCTLGCIPRKSLKIHRMPKIDSQFYSHFIRGYMDGDGTICQTTHKGYKDDWCLSIVGQYGLLEDFQKIFKKNNVITPTNSNNTCYRISYKGNRLLTRLLGFIYQDSTEEIRLNRKYKMYLSFLKEVDNKYIYNGI